MGGWGPAPPVGTARLVASSLPLFSDSPTAGHDRVKHSLTLHARRGARGLFRRVRCKRTWRPCAWAKGPTPAGTPGRCKRHGAEAPPRAPPISVEGNATVSDAVRKRLSRSPFVPVGGETEPTGRVGGARRRRWEPRTSFPPFPPLSASPTARGFPTSRACRKTSTGRRGGGLRPPPAPPSRARGERRLPGEFPAHTLPMCTGMNSSSNRRTA